MKINMAEIKEKAVGLYKKIGKKTIIIASSVLVIGIAVMLNFILWGAAKDTKKSPAVDLSNLCKHAGQVRSVTQRRLVRVPSSACA